MILFCLSCSHLKGRTATMIQEQLIKNNDVVQRFYQEGLLRVSFQRIKMQEQTAASRLGEESHITVES